MMIIRFRNDEDHSRMLNKVKKMKAFAEELEDCLEDAYDEPDSRISYRREYDDDDFRGRYDYKRGMRR